VVPTGQPGKTAKQHHPDSGRLIIYRLKMMPLIIKMATGLDLFYAKIDEFSRFKSNFFKKDTI